MNNTNAESLSSIESLSIKEQSKEGSDSENDYVPRSERVTTGLRLPPKTERAINNNWLKSILDHESLSTIAGRNPKPAGCAFKAPELDRQISPSLPPLAVKNDKTRQQEQQHLLDLLRLFTHITAAIETEGAAAIQKIWRTARDGIALAQHYAASATVSRRKDLARAANWPDAVVATCGDKSADVGEELFGDDFVDTLENYWDVTNICREMGKRQNGMRKSYPFNGNRGGQSQSSYRGGRGKNYRGQTGPIPKTQSNPSPAQY